MTESSSRRGPAPRRLASRALASRALASRAVGRAARALRTARAGVPAAVTGRSEVDRRMDPLLAGSGRTVVLLARAEDDTDDWAAFFARDTVQLLTASTPDALHEALAPISPVDVIVDLRPDPLPARRRRWRRIYWHVRTGGSYVLAWADDTATFADDAQAWARDPGAGEKSAEYGRAVRRTVVTPHVLVLRKQLTHRLKVRDAEATELLRRREPQLQVTELRRLEGGEFTSPATVWHHESVVAVSWPPERISYPAMTLRRYDGAIAFHGNTLMHTGHSILPDSFHWHLVPYLTNPFLVDSSAEFSRIPPKTLPTERLAGSYYQLDPQHGGFGHVMTEVVGRLWGWDEAKAADPDLRALFFVHHIDNYRNVPKYKVLRGFGLRDEDIVAVDHPVEVGSMTSGTVMWHNAEPFYVHPQLTAVWARLGDGLIDPATATADKIFVSRSARFARRTCRNAPEVEAMFAAAGFTVVYPEDHDLGAQAALFANARVIAGFGGSGLFNIMFARHVETTIVLSHDAYFHRNEHLFTALLGGEVHYFWSTPDAGSDPGERRSVESSWAFDTARHGADLRQLLSTL